MASQSLLLIYLTRFCRSRVFPVLIPPHLLLQQQTRAERWKITSVFKQLHQFQEEQERLLLMWLEDVEKQIVQTQTENDRKISVEISHLGNLIRELEGMSPQPENKSLQVRTRRWAMEFATLSTCH